MLDLWWIIKSDGYIEYEHSHNNLTLRVLDLSNNRSFRQILTFKWS